MKDNQYELRELVLDSVWSWAMTRFVSGFWTDFSKIERREDALVNFTGKIAHANRAVSALFASGTVIRREQNNPLAAWAQLKSVREMARKGWAEHDRWGMTLLVVEGMGQIVSEEGGAARFGANVQRREWIQSRYLFDEWGMPDRGVIARVEMRRAAP